LGESKDLDEGEFFGLIKILKEDKDRE